MPNAYLTRIDGIRATDVDKKIVNNGWVLGVRLVVYNSCSSRASAVFKGTRDRLSIIGRVWAVTGSTPSADGGTAGGGSRSNGAFSILSSRTTSWRCVVQTQVTHLLGLATRAHTE
jgi:hypothetical protein